MHGPPHGTPLRQSYPESSGRRRSHPSTTSLIVGIPRSTFHAKRAPRSSVGGDSHENGRPGTLSRTRGSPGSRRLPGRPCKIGARLKNLPEAYPSGPQIRLGSSRICNGLENLGEIGACGASLRDPGVGVPASAGPFRLKAGLQPVDGDERSGRMQGDSPGWIARTIRTRLAAVVAVVVAQLAWLWPIGIGGKMPVGGDVTQFFLGLMGFLSEALRSGELPVWNDLWGYGFPGLAESQMGVFYPPHALLYGRMFTEAAYVASLVLHTLWGGLGTFWAARRMGVSAVGAALAAFAWSSGGFFVIHLAHPWGYTTGAWMPWAWGLAWSILEPGGRAPRWAPLLLSPVLVLQVLPGHFQLAFQ